MAKVCIAFKAHMGWLNAVAVLEAVSAPTPLHVQRVELFTDARREVSEPYHVAGGWHGLERVPRPDNPAAIILAARREQVKLTTQRLIEYWQVLAQTGLACTHAVMLTGRGRLGNDLEHILGAHAQIHVAEGEAVRDATRIALDSMKIAHHNQDEKNVLGLAANLLQCDLAHCDGLMKERKPAAAKSWRKEERLIALGAWLHARPDG